MRISFRCPDCDEELLLGEESIGLNVRCTECGHEFRVTRSSTRHSQSPAKPRPAIPAEDAPPAESIGPADNPVAPETHTTPRRQPWREAAKTVPSLLGFVLCHAVAVFRRAGKFLTPATLHTTGLAAMCVSALLPFYASASSRLSGPGIWEPWSTGVLETRLLMMIQVIGVSLAIPATVARSSKRVRWLAAFGITSSFICTWLLAARRASELAGSELPLGGEWDGAGWGARLALMGAVVALGANLRAWNVPLTKPYGRFFGTTAVAAVLAIALGTAATALREAAGLDRFRIDAVAVAARDAAGQEIPGSVAVRLRVTNRAKEPVVIVARRGGQYAVEAEGRPSYWLRIQVRSHDDPRWRRLQRPAWSGPWPELDFRSSRILQPDETWPLETTVYRPDIQIVRGDRPHEVMVELTDAKRRWFFRRFVVAE